MHDVASCLSPNNTDILLLGPRRCGLVRLHIQRAVPHPTEGRRPARALYEQAEVFGGRKGKNKLVFGFSELGAVSLRLRSGIAEGCTSIFLRPTASAMGA